MHIVYGRLIVKEESLESKAKKCNELKINKHKGKYSRDTYLKSLIDLSNSIIKTTGKAFNNN